MAAVAWRQRRQTNQTGLEKEICEEVLQTIAYPYTSVITTPALILHDTRDARAPITNSFPMCHALKDNGVTVKFIAIPVAGHSPGDPVRQIGKYCIWLDWLEKYVKKPLRVVARSHRVRCDTHFLVLFRRAALGLSIEASLRYQLDICLLKGKQGSFGTTQDFLIEVL
jgi:hypothetical protein